MSFDKEKPKAFISMPMAGLEPADIEARRNTLVEFLETRGFTVVESYFPIDEEPSPLKCLGKSLLVMADCDVVVFANGWDNARGCIAEHLAANNYNLGCLYESDLKIDR